MINKLLMNGNCPICKTRIKIDTEEYATYKAKPVRIYKLKNKVESKCPGCKKIIVDEK